MVPLMLGNPCMRVQDRGENHEPGRVQGAQQDSPTTELDLGFVLFRVRILAATALDSDSICLTGVSKEYAI